VKPILQFDVDGSVNRGGLVSCSVDQQLAGRAEIGGALVAKP
jgi:ABC-type uncharacterized transport system substrate-binding protein